MSQNKKISTKANSNPSTTRINSSMDLKILLTNFSKSLQGRPCQDVLDPLVGHAVQYIEQFPGEFENNLSLSENDCVEKIINILNTKPNIDDGEVDGQVFHEHYNDATHHIEDPRTRHLLANLLLCSMEGELNQPNQIDPYPSSSTQTLCIGKSQNGDVNAMSLMRSELYSYDPSQLDVGLGHHPVPNFMLELSKKRNVDVMYDIVQNAIYSFMGVQGKYLKKDVITGRFKLDSVNLNSLTMVQSGMLLRLSELGFYHDCVSKFSNALTGYNAMGCMGQAFMCKLKSELNKFHGQVAILQDQLNIYRQAQIEDYVDREHTWLEKKQRHEPITLMKLLCWYMEPLRRMQWLTKIADICQLKKGGELTSVVYEFLNNGDPMVDKLASDLLTACCTPLVCMISKWMLEGGIEDPHGEFFVESLPDVGADRLWHDKFRLRLNMLPKFITLELADKILKTGKSINFLREICKVEEAVKGRKELKNVIDNNVSQIFSHVPDTSWHAAIETCYAQTSKHVLDIMVGPHKLLEHLHGMRRYLLLGQGDFISIFIENMKEELEKIGSEIYSHDLSAMLDAALRCTNAQYDDPEILNHLDVIVKTPFPGDRGWDVISLQYTVRGPLATMLEPAMPTYKSVFKPLWRIKHMEFVLSTKIWKEQMGNAKALRSLNDEIGKATYKLHLFTSEIMHFVHQMQYYVLFEVIECSWVELQKRMQQATALDEILDAHSKFLHAISIGCFVNTSTNMENHLEVVYDTIIYLENLQTQFYVDCFVELTARQEMAKAIADSELKGDFGITTEQKMERDQEQKIFEQTVVSFYRNLENSAVSYGKAVGGFLLLLNLSDDPNLQLFGTRLDFNEFYKKRDTNLSKPLTFEHMRMSNIMGNSKSHQAGRYSMHPQVSASQFGPMAHSQLSWE